MIERWVAIDHEDLVTGEHLERETLRQIDKPLRLRDAVREMEKRLLSTALQVTGSTRKAARKLGISQASFLRRARKYGIDTGGVKLGGDSRDPISDRP